MFIFDSIKIIINWFNLKIGKYIIFDLNLARIIKELFKIYYKITLNFCFYK